MKTFTNSKTSFCTLQTIIKHAIAIGGLLVGAAAYGQKAYTPASMYAGPELECNVYPTGLPSQGIPVFTDDDGYARFHAVRASSPGDPQQLTLSCKDSSGKTTTYTADLTSDDTFASRPLNLANERGIDRPALTGDPLSYSQLELIQKGYGLRPDAKDTAAYARWLGAAKVSGRILAIKRPSAHSHTISTGSANPWTGSVMTGASSYISTEAVWNVPGAIPGGDGTTKTEVAIWNGLGGVSAWGLIQGGVSLVTSPTVASYNSWREYCCGDTDSNGYGGAFVPTPGDRIYSQEWYCDSVGNLNLNGGYGCTFVEDQTSGAILSCTSSTGKPCWSVQALPLCNNTVTSNCFVVGTSAEFVIELQSGQLQPPPPVAAFTDFFPAVTMAGSAATDATSGYTQTISTDPAVTLDEDFTNTVTHIDVSLGTTDQTIFKVSKYPPPVLNITSPQNNAAIQVAPGVPVNFTATVSDQKDGNWPLKSYSTNGPTVITWSSDVDGTYVYNGNDGGTSIPIDFTHAPEGVRHITATVTDSAGLTSIATLTVNIQFPHITPSPVITFPTLGADLPPGTYTVTGYALSTDPGVLGNFACTRLKFNGTQAVPLPNTPGQCEAQLTLNGGNDRISLSATDEFGDTGTTSVAVNVAPQSQMSVQILNPTNGSTDIIMVDSPAPMGLSGNAAGFPVPATVTYTWYWYPTSAGANAKSQIGTGPNSTWNIPSSSVCKANNGENVTILLDVQAKSSAIKGRPSTTLTGSATSQVQIVCESIE